MEIEVIIERHEQRINTLERDMESIVDIRKIKKCAFCKHWYDPANTAIEPRAPQMGLWNIVDTNKKCKCLKRNLAMPAHASCMRDYICKI